MTDPETSAAQIGTLVAFYEYIQRFFIPIRDLSSKYTIIQSSLASAERVFGLLDTDELDAPARTDVDAPRPPKDVSVAFRDVTFAYREGHPVLSNVSVDIARGETVAVVGATGSGKTTLTSLLLRLYELQQGYVVVEGDDVRELSRDELRSRFAMVPQDVFLFRGTILSNVALGDAQPDEDRAQQALERVGAWDLINEREQHLDSAPQRGHAVAERGGLQTLVEDRGQNFSAGERQLIAFARALYRDPSILVLDEATANIDSETESRLQKAVEEVVQDRTSIIIAHRLSTIRSADRILVMHHGQIAEEGTHSELLQRGGIYARLHRLQFGEDDVAAAAP